MESSSKPLNITSTQANSNVLVRGKPGVLSRFLISKASAQVISVYDGIDTTTLTNNVLLATLPASMAAGAYECQWALTKGLVLAVAASYAGDSTFATRAG